MSRLIAALPMYDWPEVRPEVDAEWAALRSRLRGQGVDAPEEPVRRNADMPAVPGGIRDADGQIIAPDPATLAPDELDLPTLWRHPALIFAQTCRGPLELGLAAHVRVVGQPDYSGFVGGEGSRYRSAVVMRREAATTARAMAVPPSGGRPYLPLDLLDGARLAFNSEDSMSGLLALERDLAAGQAAPVLLGARLRTGSHRASIRFVAEGRADVAAIDCRTWAMALAHEPAATECAVVGWTALRPGLPYITAPGSPEIDWNAILGRPD